MAEAKSTDHGALPEQERKAQDVKEGVAKDLSREESAHKKEVDENKDKKGGIEAKRNESDKKTREE